MFKEAFYMRYLKIKSRARFAISMLILFLIFYFILNLFTTKVFSYQAPHYQEITVSQGDTLWSLASQLDGNINENIYEIQKINNINGCNIYIGQSLKIPIN